MEPSWTRGAEAANEEVLATATLARQKAEIRIASAEARGARLTQFGLALMATVLAISGFEAGRLRGAHVAPVWFLVMAPAAGAVFCLLLVIVLAIGVDGVAAVVPAGPDDVAAQPCATERRREQIRQEAYAALVADWSADHKLQEVLQARAWLTRAIVAGTLAGIIAVFVWVMAVPPAAPATQPQPAVSVSPSPRATLG